MLRQGKGQVATQNRNKANTLKRVETNKVTTMMNNGSTMVLHYSGDSNRLITSSS